MEECGVEKENIVSLITTVIIFRSILIPVSSVGRFYGVRAHIDSRPSLFIQNDSLYLIRLACGYSLDNSAVKYLSSFIFVWFYIGPFDVSQLSK